MTEENLSPEAAKVLAEVEAEVKQQNVEEAPKASLTCAQSSK